MGTAWSSRCVRELEVSWVTPLASQRNGATDLKSYPVRLEVVVTAIWFGLFDNEYSVP